MIGRLNLIESKYFNTCILSRPSSDRTACARYAEPWLVGRRAPVDPCLCHLVPLHIVLDLPILIAARASQVGHTVRRVGPEGLRRATLVSDTLLTAVGLPC